MIWNENGLSGKRYAALRKRTKVLSLWRHLALPFTDWPNSTTRFGKHYAVDRELELLVWHSELFSAEGSSFTPAAALP